jgi:hypothetical protein
MLMSILRWVILLVLFFVSALFFGLYSAIGLICFILYVWALFSIIFGRIDLGSKIVWILVLLILPGLGLLIWFLFGPRR